MKGDFEGSRGGRLVVCIDVELHREGYTTLWGTTNHRRRQVLGIRLPLLLGVPPDKRLVKGTADQVDALLVKVLRLLATQLCLAMTAEHRREIVQETPAALRRTVLFDEVVQAARAGAELEGSTPAERLADIPLAISAFRPELAAMVIADVPDPYRRPQAEYDAAFELIEAGVKDIAAWVRG